MSTSDHQYTVLRVADDISPVRVDVNGVGGSEDHPLFTMKELEEAVLAIKYKKVPGLNSITVKAFKLVFRYIQRLREGSILPLKDDDTCIDQQIYRTPPTAVSISIHTLHSRKTLVKLIRSNFAEGN